MKKLVLALCLSLLVPALAQAAIMTYDFGGMIIATSGINGLAAGQAYTGWVSFSTDKVISESSSTYSPNGLYNSPLTFEITAGGKTYSSNGLTKYLDGLQTVRVDSNQLWPSGTTTSLSGGASNFSPPPGPIGGLGGWSLQWSESLSLRMTLAEGGSTTPGNSFYLRHILTEYGPPAFFSLAGDALIDVNQDLGCTIDSFSQRAEPTPLPAAVWLLGSGLGLAGLRRWRKKA